MEKIPMTEEGQKKLLDELKHLKTVSQLEELLLI